MSRTYKKHILVQICYGDNRSYYTERRRRFRRTRKTYLRNLLANYSVDDVNDLYVDPKHHMRDTWDEPTDGHYGVSLDMYKQELKVWPYSRAPYYEKQVDYYLNTTKKRKNY